MRRPSSIGSPGCHRWRSLPIALRHQLASTRLSAARAPLEVMHGGARSDSTLATIPRERAAVGQASRWPRCGVPELRRASRTVRFTRSIKAVFSRPEKPIPCKEALRAASVPRRMTCVTRTSLRQRSAFFHLAIDQVRRHLPPVHVAPSASLLPPCPKMSCQSREVHV